GCAGELAERRHELPPPARESRAGAPERSAGPAPAPAAPPASEVARRPELERALASVTSLVGHVQIVLDGVDYGPGCAALVRAAFAESGHPLPPEVRDAAAVAAVASERGSFTPVRRPVVGDLVFLSDRPGGPPTHVGVVARTEPDGTAFVYHRVARGVVPMRINLAYPERPTDPATGKHINDTLIVNSRPLPAGSLVVGLSDLLRRGG
ncbi:MAG TPA: CHAP domain-containing protein, partial [Anaeromyxobacteraceae bacterium]|nr:CHAP domain-containing protein [Anaeromyxobacteraceae bacterium]